MKRKSTMALIALFVCVCILSVCACSENSQTLYNVATQLGYEDGEDDWIASVTGAGTEARKMYEEAVADGYEGSYVDFLKEIGYSVNTDGSESISEALTSVVYIRCGFSFVTTTGGFGRPMQQTESTAYSRGSGVIYSLDSQNGDAYIVTNYHVVYEAESKGDETIAHISDDIAIYLYGSLYEDDSCKIEASYLGGSMEQDIAVLEVKDSEVLKNSYARAAKIGDSDALSAGETVYAVGNANSDGISVTQGVISVEAEYITMTTADETTEVSMLEVRTDAAVNHGNSGGGLFNTDGRLIGIVNARSEEDGVVSFGYAVPVNLARAVAQNVIDNSGANKSKGALRAMLGVTVQITDCKSVYNEDTQKTYIVETVEVKEVTSGIVSGKLLTGDIIYSVRINDKPEKVITRLYMIGNTMFDVRKGDTVTLIVGRGDETLTISLEYDSDSYFSLYD